MQKFCPAGRAASWPGFQPIPRASITLPNQRFPLEDISCWFSLSSTRADYHASSSSFHAHSLPSIPFLPKGTSHLSYAEHVMGTSRINALSKYSYLVRQHRAVKAGATSQLQQQTSQESWAHSASAKCQKYTLIGKKYSVSCLCFCHCCLCSLSL